MKFKKLISMGLAGVMVVGMLAGCGDLPTTPDTTPDTTPSTGSQETTKPADTKPADTTTQPVQEVKAVAAKIEEKKISDAAAKLLATMVNDFGGETYLDINDYAYGTMMNGEYEAGTNVKNPVGNKDKAVVLNLSVLYNKLRMSYTLDKEYKAADGVTYKKGDLLPTWKQIETDCGFTINDVTSTAADVAKNYTEAKTNNFMVGNDAIDIICVKSASANEDGQTGSFVQLDQYFDYMPNFKAFLDANEVVKTTITAGDGHIYFAPYFDGYDDIEKTPLVRIDWVKALLNGSYDASKFDGAYTGSMSYTAYMPASAKGAEAIEVKVVDGNAVKTIKKEYDKNITAVLKDLSNKSGATLVKALRDYIDTTYNGYYGENRADLFIGQNAAYDADEFVALLRCVVANPKFLTGGDVVYGLFGREATLQRTTDMVSFACQLFGVRGAESRKDYLYFDATGKLCDARQSEDFYYVIEKMNQMYADGLILKDFDLEGAGGASGTKVYEQMYNSNLGFALYDYVQTQTAYNNTVKVEGFDLESILTPVAYWYTSADSNGNLQGTWTRFTESWRSVKTEGWSITKACASNPDKLANALELFDFLYSKEGNLLMSYGPYDWVEHDAKGNVVTIDYQGTQVPKLSAAALKELAELTNGNYTNYYRQYLAATFPVGYIKQQGMEYQCTAENGKRGLEKVNKAIELGVIEHILPNNADCATPFYRMVPTTFATGTSDNNTLKTQCANLGTYASKEKNKYNIFMVAIKEGFEGAVSADPNKQ